MVSKQDLSGSLMLFCGKKNKGTSDEELEEKRNKIYEDIFREMKARDCKKLALPLLSTGDGGAQVAHFANCFIENVYSFSKSNKDYKFTIHVVNRDQGKIDECVATVRRSIDYIKKNEQAAKGARQKTRNSADIKPTGRGRPTQQNSASQSSKQTKPSNRQIAGAVSSLENPRLNGKEDTVKKPGDETEVTARDPKESDFKTKKTESKTIKESENEEENCVICMDKFDNPMTLKCGHRFCTECIDASFKQKAACPICGTVCGTITGNQPRGEMLIKNQKDQYCAGYESYGRIEITYRFSDGVQGRDHPSPGKPYRGITRTAYLPDNKNGRIICVLLQIAFDRKLVFTIGNSRTTGKEGVITWNDIHHKTDPKPNSQFGYPDPTYLSRVLDELKAKGVTQDDITSVGGHK